MSHNFDDEDDWHFGDAADDQIQHEASLHVVHEEHFEDIEMQAAFFLLPSQHDADVRGVDAVLDASGSPARPSSHVAAAVLPVALQTPVAGAVRRKRLRTKTPPGNGCILLDTPEPVERAVAAAAGRPVLLPAEGPDSKKYNRMLSQLKYWYARKVEGSTNQDANPDRPQGVDFRRLTVEGKVALVQEWLRDTTMGSEDLKRWALTFYQSQRDIEATKRSRYINSRTVMLTYQGPWGLVAANSFAEPLAGMSVESVVAELKQRSEVKNFVVRFANGSSNVS